MLGNPQILDTPHLLDFFVLLVNKSQEFTQNLYALQLYNRGKTVLYVTSGALFVLTFIPSQSDSHISETHVVHQGSLKRWIEINNMKFVFQQFLNYFI